MPYRDDQEARQARCSEIERQLTDLRRRKSEWHALEAAIAELERDLALQRSLLHRLTLPVLDNLRVASPCDMNWDEMSGDARSRFCGKCAKHVYNLSNMTRAEGEALIAEKEGKLCVRFYQRADGTVLSADCPVGMRKLRFRRVVMAGAGVSMLLSGAMWMTAMMRMGAPMRPPAMGSPAAISAPLVPAPPVRPSGPPCQGEPTMPTMGSIAVAPPPPAVRHPLMGKPRLDSPKAPTTIGHVKMGKMAPPDEGNDK